MKSRTLSRYAILLTLPYVLGITGCTTPNARNDKLIELNSQALDIIAALMETKSAAPDASAENRPAPSPVAQNPAAAPLPTQKARAVEGRLRSVGSDTMDNLMEFWKEGFVKQHPNIAFYHQGHGSSTAAPALMENKAELGPMSRQIKSSEEEAFRKRFGYDPVQLRVAVDAIAVYVHPDNPLAKQGLTFRQLDAIFSKTRLRGGSEVLTWGDLGLTGEWAKAPVNIYGRNSASGTHSFFKSAVLTGKGEYTDRCKALVGSEELVTAIENDRHGIGYSGIGYRTARVGVVALSEEHPESVFPPEMQYAYSGEYPLSRFLYLLVNRNPSSSLPEHVRNFIEHVYSKEGQSVVMKDGFFPVSSKIVQEEKIKLGM